MKIQTLLSWQLRKYGSRGLTTKEMRILSLIGIDRGDRVHFANILQIYIGISRKKKKLDNVAPIIFHG